MEQEKINAEVISVKPDKVRISVEKLEDFKIAEEDLKVGSYLQISDDNDIILIAIIESFSIDLVEVQKEDKKGSLYYDLDRKYIIEASPLGVIEDEKFVRGGDTLSIPPKKVKPAELDYIKNIFENSVSKEVKFCFSKLSSNQNVDVPVNGNLFFNKHIAIVGASGSGKSHTIAKVLQNAAKIKNEGVEGLNNSHIVIFDIHSEYKTAFPEANTLDIDNLVLPYWLLNAEELEELFLESGDRNNYNQASVLRKVITENKKIKNPDKRNIFFDSPIPFDIDEILNCLINLKNETINAKSENRIMIVDKSYSLDNGKTDLESGIMLNEEEKICKYFEKVFEFHPTKNQNITKGNYSDGTLDKFISRFQRKIKDNRLKFIFGESTKEVTFVGTLKKLLSYFEEIKSNITLIDLSGIPFEVLSITVSLISRLLFEYGYYYKKQFEEIKTPLLLVYEEAHKYAPKSDLSRYRSSTIAIERIAKEGRKYGVTLAIVSQRPSEISETIFSQCNNFIAMRLTNPDDQNYVKRLLPDTLEGVTGKLPSLQCGEAILIGDSVVMPSVVQIDRCEETPSSNDIKYIEIWKNDWEEVNFNEITDIWES